MKFKFILKQKQGNKIPFNYQYPLSSAIYKIIQQADEEYATLLHDKGFGKGFKFFTFSDLNFKKFNYDKEGIIILDNEILLLFIDIYLPKTVKNLIKGVFENKKLVIADKYLKTEFVISSVEIMDDKLTDKNPDELIKVRVQTTSPMVVGRKNERGNYDYLHPEEEDFKLFLVKNWFEKIKTFDESRNIDFLDVETLNTDNAKSKLVVLKNHTKGETKIKGFKNFNLSLIGKRKDIDLLISAGLGIYNAQGMGSVKIIE